MSLRSEGYKEKAKGAAAKKFPTTTEIPPKHLFHPEQPGRPRDSAAAVTP